MSRKRKHPGGPKLVSFHDALKARFPDKPLDVSPEDLARFRAILLRLHDHFSALADPEGT